MTMPRNLGGRVPGPICQRSSADKPLFAASRRRPNFSGAVVAHPAGSSCRRSEPGSCSGCLPRGLVNSAIQCLEPIAPAKRSHRPRTRGSGGRIVDDRSEKRTRLATRAAVSKPRNLHAIVFRLRKIDVLFLQRASRLIQTKTRRTVTVMASAVHMSERAAGHYSHPGKVITC